MIFGENPGGVRVARLADDRGCSAQKGRALTSRQKEGRMAQQYDVIAATGCPTGIAHTFMAKEALEKAAAERGLTIKVSMCR